MQIEYNRFFNKPDGGKSEHVKVICADFTELAAAMEEVEGLFTYPLDDIPYETEPFEPRTPVAVTQAQANGQGRAPGRPPPASQRQQARGMSCGMCNGDTYDNRSKKAKGEYGATSPDYTCKDKENCNARMWLKTDGTEGEWKYPKL